MSAPLVVPTDLYVQGNLFAQTFTPPAASILDAAIAPAAAVQASKLQHQYVLNNVADDFAATTAVRRRVCHVVRGATATLVAFQVGVVVAAVGAATVTVDLLKNGVSVLSAVVTIDNTLTAFALRSGTITSASCVASDVIEVKIATASAGGGTLPAGFFSHLVVREDAQ